MHRLTIEVDDDTCSWLERRRGGASPEEFAALALTAYRAIYESGLRRGHEHGTDARMARMQADMAYRLDELQQRIRQLDAELRERGPALSGIIR